MFIRFVSSEHDEDSHVSAGLFSAAFNLRCSLGLPQYELDALVELVDWFNVHLESPFTYLRPAKRHERAISWFKPTAGEHLARAWELIAILERNDVLIWPIKSTRTGYIYYEDDYQVLAEPFADLRLQL